jgi:hypothetical protein
VQHPDHDTIADFRKRHIEALAGLFTQALLLSEKAGLVKLGHVAASCLVRFLLNIQVGELLVA